MFGKNRRNTMITEIKTRDSSNISYVDNGDDLYLTIGESVDCSEYIDIKVYGEPNITIPKSIIPELIKVLEKLR